jgi:hypothetical protein
VRFFNRRRRIRQRRHWEIDVEAFYKRGNDNSRSKQGKESAGRSALQQNLVFADISHKLSRMPPEPLLKKPVSHEDAASPTDRLPILKNAYPIIAAVSKFIAQFDRFPSTVVLREYRNEVPRRAVSSFSLQPLAFSLLPTWPDFELPSP